MGDRCWLPSGSVLSVSVSPWTWSPWTLAGVGTDSRCSCSDEDREGSKGNRRELEAAHTGAGSRDSPGWDAALHHRTEERDSATL